MLVDEAVGLVLQSALLTTGCEGFILNMGEPVNIYNMAQQLIRLSGQEPGKDIEIKVVGLRPGEKLYEELLLEGSESHTTIDDLFIAKPEMVDPSAMIYDIKKLVTLAIDGREKEVCNMLEKLCDVQFQQQTQCIDFIPKKQSHIAFSVPVFCE